MNLKRRKYSVVLLAFFALITCKTQEIQKSETDFNPLTGPYFGQKPPGMTPEVFEPQIVSTGLDELNSVFSPDGREFYFCVRNFLGAVSIFQMTMEGETWSQPKLLPFASRYGDIDVTMSPDGKRILFSSRRPVPGSEEPRGDYDFWMVEREDEAWGEPVYLGEDINSDSHDYYPMMTNSGAIYFSSQREGPGTNNIYRSEIIDGKYAKAVKLSIAINTEHREFDPYISPDESILIFTSSRPEGLGSGDLYISFKDKEGNWTKAENMGDKINTPGSEYCPMISPDGKYLFFTSAGRDSRRIPDKPLTYQDFKMYHNGSKNGLSDIYWVDATIIEEIGKETLGASPQESENLKKVVNDGYGDYLLVPEGEFEMGDNFNEGFPDERPVHRVYLSDYYIGKHEVTNVEYKKFIDDNGYENEDHWRAGGFCKFGTQPLYWDNNTDADPRDGKRGTTFYEGRHVHGGGVPGHENFPVNGVSWYEAMAYCSWLSSRTGHRYRLPTEAEWEKASRGTYEHNRDNPELGHQRRYPWGDDIDNSYGNFWNSGDPYDNGTTPVGYYDGSKHGDYQTKNNASPYGAYDMTGNVFEWCLDWYVRSEKEKYYHNPLCAGRNYDPPHWRGANFGFRCVREK